MNECHKCKDLVELHPEYQGMDFKDVPCSKCTLKMKPLGHVDSEHHLVRYSEKIAGQEKDTWEILDIPLIERATETFRYWLDAWSKLTRFEQETMEIIIRYPGENQSYIARKLGVTRQAVNKRIKKFRKKWPGVI